MALLLAFLASLYATVATAQDADGWAFGIHFENDLFADTDQQYTSGIKLTAVSPDLTSAFRDRPELPGWARYRTPVRGLFLCGAGTHPGGGVMGACGRNAAGEILRERSGGAGSGA